MSKSWFGNGFEEWLSRVDQYLAEISDDTVYEAMRDGWDAEAQYEKSKNAYEGLESLLGHVNMREAR